MQCKALNALESIVVAQYTASLLSQKGTPLQASTPNEAEGLLSAGISALRAGDNIRARDLLGQAIRLNPRDERAWLWLSGAIETDAERRQCLERVLTLNPHNAAARNGLALLAAAANTPTAATAPSATVPTPSPAIPPVAPAPVHVVAATPVIAPPALTPLADIDTPAAVDSLASLRPTSVRTRVNPRVAAAIALACVVVVIGAIMLARRFGGPSSASQPTAAAVIAVAASATPTTQPTPTRARPTQTATATPTATPSATAAPTSTPSEAGKLVLQGLAKAQSNDYLGAIVLYNQALARDPQNVEAFFQRGQARDGLGDPQSAIKNYTLVLQIDPNHGAAYSARGDARLKLKDKPRALEDYQRAAEIYTSAGDTKRAEAITAKIKALQ
jgi:tetratricopeptide (TPR) repeat protein